jgi:predicted nucleic acid-binding protein
VKLVFADSYYFLALWNPSDSRHQMAAQLARDRGTMVITTFWVLMEVADGLSRSRVRGMIPSFIRALRENHSVSIVPPTVEDFDMGLNLYSQRPDKDWSLTDCISFIVMERRGLTEALTGDRHFEQAGFKAVLSS